MSERPVIGIMSRITPFFHEQRPYPRAGVAIAYCQGVELAGGVSVIIPMTRDRAVIDALFDRLDGVLLPGGSDVNPVHYGEQPHRKLELVDPVRDIAELHIASRALAEKKPVLAICRGEQVMNVAAGGTLHQDIHAQVNEECLNHFQNYTEEVPSHTVAVKGGSLLHDIVGEDEVMVNSYHHQSVKRVAEGFEVNCVAPDGVIEGIECPSHPFALGVQWHPELLVPQRDFNLALFRRLIEASAKHRVTT